MAASFLCCAIACIAIAQAFTTELQRHSHVMSNRPATCFANTNNGADTEAPESSGPSKEKIGADTEAPESSGPSKEKIIVIGAGWGGLSAAHALATSHRAADLDITLVDAAPKVGGLVRDGFRTLNNTAARAEAGQHGFWDNYRNIFALLEDGPLNIDIDEVLTGYAEQGQYSPRGLEAVWPVYRDARPALPTGLAQAFYTRFERLGPRDLASALPLVLAFSDFDDSPAAWEKYDDVSFRDLCVRLGVSRRCYQEAFEPMILTGLFAPGAECSAAAALGMAYFFVLRSQNSFDVRWCRGNIGQLIFDPWVAYLEGAGVTFATSTRVQGFDVSAGADRITGVRCSKADGGGSAPESVVLEADKVVFAVGGAALGAIVRNSPELSQHAEFRKFANLRGTGVLATRLYLDRVLDTPYSANACWGFDEGVGMTYFDITKLHGLEADDEDESGEVPGSVIEIDYYHAASLLAMSDAAIVDKAKGDLDTILGAQSVRARVLDAAVVRLPQAVNWYSPGSYKNMPDARSAAVSNAFFAGDLVRSRHGSWSQEKAYVTGVEAANLVLGRAEKSGILPLAKEEPHVALSRTALGAARTLAGRGDARGLPGLADFLF